MAIGCGCILLSSVSKFIAQNILECSGRRKDNCPFKIGTYHDEDETKKVN
jgi:hypothetical protein